MLVARNLSRLLVSLLSSSNCSQELCQALQGHPWLGYPTRGIGRPPPTSRFASAAPVQASAVAQQGRGPTGAPQLLELGRSVLVPACLRQFHASSLQSSAAAAAAAAEPEPVPHASWEETELSSAQLTPRQVVELLDRYIVGQGAAKKAVANALRNRWRRHKVPSPLRVGGGRSANPGMRWWMPWRCKCRSCHVQAAACGGVQDRPAPAWTRAAAGLSLPYYSMACAFLCRRRFTRRTCS